MCIGPITPHDVQLIDVRLGQLIFGWSAVALNCSALQYTIESDCGNCTDMFDTTSTTVTCSVQIEVSPAATPQCTFAVKSVVCGNIASSWSDPITATLKGI